ncbi:MAG: hypothetical protein AAF805_10555 [Planctomycetota bacterium]
MSMGPVGGVVGSAAGTALSQTKGATSERVAADTQAQATTDELDLKAEKASGIGQTEGDQEASDRDADGRRMWERPSERDEQASDEAADPANPAGADPPAGGLDLIA